MAKFVRLWIFLFSLKKGSQYDGSKTDILLLFLTVEVEGRKAGGYDTVMRFAFCCSRDYAIEIILIICLSMIGKKKPKQLIFK